MKEVTLYFARQSLLTAMLSLSVSEAKREIGKGVKEVRKKPPGRLFTIPKLEKKKQQAA